MALPPDDSLDMIVSFDKSRIEKENIFKMAPRENFGPLWLELTIYFGTGGVPKFVESCS